MRLFIGNLSYEMTTQDVRALFEGFGMVRDARVLTDRDTGRSRGFGFVEMDSDQESRTAIAELNGSRVMGRDIVVNEAKPRENAGVRGGWNGGDGPRNQRSYGDRDDGGRGRRDRGR